MYIKCPKIVVRRCLLSSTGNCVNLRTAAPRSFEDDPVAFPKALVCSFSAIFPWTTCSFLHSTVFSLAIFAAFSSHPSLFPNNRPSERSVKNQTKSVVIPMDYTALYFNKVSLFLLA